MNDLQNLDTAFSTVVGYGGVELCPCTLSSFTVKGLTAKDYG